MLSSCFSCLHERCQRGGRSPQSKGLQRLSTHWRGNHVFMTFYNFSIAVSILLFNWWQVSKNPLPPSIIPLSPSECNSDWVVVGGHLKWTPQRPCLGNEIALAMAFCHITPQCILMISGTWCSIALQDLHSSTSTIRLRISLSPSVTCHLHLTSACFLINLPEFSSNVINMAVTLVSLQ